MWVIKLGGSLLGQPELPQWLNALTRFGDGKIVIVPGGGLFADAVREAQAETLIADGLAHEMAVMAMDQYAMLMTGLNPDLVMAASELEIAESGSIARLFGNPLAWSWQIAICRVIGI